MKSILKRGNIKEVESPELRKKEVAFSVRTTQVLVPDIGVEAVESEDQKLDESLFQTRKRSKSTEGGPKSNILPKGVGEFDSDENENELRRRIISKNVSVGRVQDGIAVILTEDFNVMEIPLSMLPEDVRKGNILKFTVERNIIEEESRKENIVRMQRELLMDKSLFDDYNKKLEYFKNKKMEFLQSNTKGNANLQKALDAVNVNLQESSFLDRSEIAFDDRVIIKPRTSTESKQDRTSISSKQDRTSISSKQDRTSISSSGKISGNQK